MITYIDRKTGKKEKEKVYGEAALKFLYGGSFIGSLLAFLASRFFFVSWLYGFWQKRPWTRSKIQPFIQAYGVDPSEFVKQPQDFTSFNDFFIRELKPESRPLSSTPLIIPADARYLAYQTINEDKIIVKGQKFNLTELFGDEALAKRYAEGSLLMARLCPSDYHRFHFPTDCTPGESRLINGFLYSVNPIALDQRLSIFWENKRKLTLLKTESFGEIAYFEVGATNVGTIIHTHQAFSPAKKGAEKGYFSFGGSALLLFFEPGKVKLSEDLLAATAQGLETRCLLGQPLI